MNKKILLFIIIYTIQAATPALGMHLLLNIPEFQNTEKTDSFEQACLGVNLEEEMPWFLKNDTSYGTLLFKKSVLIARLKQLKTSLFSIALHNDWVDVLNSLSLEEKSFLPEDFDIEYTLTEDEDDETDTD